VSNWQHTDGRRAGGKARFRAIGNQRRSGENVIEC
jgi:hypothetical protein